MANTSKPIAVFDIDGTIFRSSLLVEITRAMIKVGAFPPEAEDEYKKEYVAWRRRQGSYDDYLQKVVLTFEQHLKGVGQPVLETMSELVIKNLALESYRYTRDLINKLKQTHFLVAISGSPAELVSRFASQYGFADYKATEYHLKNGIYDGQATLGLKDKDKTLKQMVKKHSLTLEGSWGVGDTESDAAFLRLVEHPVAFNPNRVLFEQAAKQGWPVVIERKNMVYKLNRHDDEYRLSLP